MSSSNYESGVLPSPLGPGILRICPACRKRFALRLKSKRADKVFAEVATYRCKACGHEVEFAKQPPANTL